MGRTQNCPLFKRRQTPLPKNRSNKWQAQTRAHEIDNQEPLARAQARRRGDKEKGAVPPRVGLLFKPRLLSLSPARPFALCFLDFNVKKRTVFWRAERESRTSTGLRLDKSWDLNTRQKQQARSPLDRCRARGLGGWLGGRGF